MIKFVWIHLKYSEIVTYHMEVVDNFQLRWQPYSRTQRQLILIVSLPTKANKFCNLNCIQEWWVQMSYVKTSGIIAFINSKCALLQIIISLYHYWQYHCKHISFIQLSILNFTISYSFHTRKRRNLQWILQLFYQEKVYYNRSIGSYVF